MDLMNIAAWVVVGGLAGWVASMLMKTDASMGMMANVVVGILGAFLGGWIMNMMGQSATAVTGFNWMSFFVALLGACVLLFVVKLVRGRM